MKVLLIYDYPPPPGGLATQAELLHRGLKEMGVDVYAVNPDASQEKEWYYSWLKPDVAVGVGYWGHTPDLVLHPQRFGIMPVPWLVADGYITNYQDVLDKLPLILTTSQWVKSVYIRDGLKGDNMEVLPVGCDTDSFVPRDKNDPRVADIRRTLGVTPEQIMLLTVGGDAASKGGQEVMQALGQIDSRVPDWRYVCKVWPQPRTFQQNQLDLQLAATLGIEKKIIYAVSKNSRNFMPYLLSACDIYCAPSRLEGFGMVQVEAGACGKPVIGMNAMAMMETMIHGETAFLAGVGKEIVIKEVTLGPESGYEPGHKVVFDPPRIADYRASVNDIATYLLQLMQDPALRQRMGEAGRKRVVANYDYRMVARKFIEIISRRLGIS